MNLASILTDSAQRNGDHAAIKLDDAELTYSQLDGASAHIAGLLRAHGFESGDRVGIMLPNVPYFPVVYYGVLRAGGVVVPSKRPAGRHGTPWARFAIWWRGVSRPSWEKWGKAA